jgi:NAD(P)-dependent dehydrogenase (short-subunit alcohol dehydrogenase family)
VCVAPDERGREIVNISSVAGRTGIAGGRSLYSAAKAGIDALTRNWALELAPRHILVNAVAPGYIATDMTANHLGDPATFERAIGRHPLGRLGTPEDIADVVAFLCSHSARFITGQSINVSGGFVIWIAPRRLKRRTSASGRTWLFNIAGQWQRKWLVAKLAVSRKRKWLEM